MHVHQNDEVEPALQVSASFALDCLQFLGSGAPVEPTVWSRSKSTNRDLELTFLGSNINTHTGWVHLAIKNIDILRDRLEEWPLPRKGATAKGVISLTGKLWNVTYAFRAGIFFLIAPELN